MANNQSRLTICVAMTAILLMLLSAIPVSAEMSEPNPRPITSIIVEEGQEPTWDLPAGCSWDEKECVLTIDGEVTLQGLQATTSSKDLAIVIIGKLTFENMKSNMSYGITMWAAKNAYIRGGGSLDLDIGTIETIRGDALSNDGAKYETKISDLASITVKNGCIRTDGSLLIENCGTVSVSCEGGTEESAPICTTDSHGGTLTITGTHLALKRTGTFQHPFLLHGNEGIVMSGTPSGRDCDIRFENDATFDADSNDEWKSGETKTVFVKGSGSEGDIVLDFESDGKEEEKSDDNTMLYAGLGIIIVILILLLLFFLYKRRKDEEEKEQAAKAAQATQEAPKQEESPKQDEQPKQ